MAQLHPVRAIRTGFQALLVPVVCLLVAVNLAPAPARAGDLAVHVFWQEGCPHCANAKETLGALAGEIPGLQLKLYEVGRDPANAGLLRLLIALFRVESPGVPFVVIGDRHVMGHAGGGMARSQYLALIERCRSDGCVDLAGQLLLLSKAAAGQVTLGPGTPDPGTTDAEPPAGAGNDTAQRRDTGPAGPPTALPETVTLPIFGEITLASLSLPLLTVVLAGIDGFNPCAMWVLVLLIGLLAGVADARRMWTLGLVFLGATGVMYFGVMAAWLNVVLWVGALVWLRIAIGALAVGAGLHYLRDYWTNPDGVCAVTSPGSRKRITDAFRSVVRQPSLILAAIGIAGLAIVVNLIELVCSAGVPAVYTQILALHELSTPAYYGYLLLYLAVFLLDDAVIFATAMLTLHSGLFTGRYTRISHALGGGLLLSLGAVMILRPDWLG